MSVPEISISAGNVVRDSAIHETFQKAYLSEPDTPAISSTNKFKILIVDDEVFLVQLIKNYLSYNDYEVVTANSGMEAIELINRERNFDLVILDVMMPEMTGYEVCRLIREQFSLFELPIIMLTVKNNIADMVEGFESGANDYISKPFDRNELLARAKTLIKLKRLTRANEILQEAIDIKNQFLNMTIHDLKNPLSVILGLTDLMKNEVTEESNLYDFISLIGESAGLMHNLVNELLDAARIESGKLTLHKEPVDLVAFARQVIDKNKQRASQKKQEIIFRNVCQSGQYILADPIRVQEIMDNLISNAIKYSPLDEIITVSVLSYTDDKGFDYIRYEVSDNGPGLTNEDKKRIFGKFQRLSAQPTGGESSTGLGLSIVKQLVELHNGKIWVESEAGKGSTFIAEFPVYTKQKDVSSRKKKVRSDS